QSPPSDPIANALGWLAKHVNAEDGWGDTIHNLSNISTTALCWAAFGAVPGADEQYQSTVGRPGQWLHPTRAQRERPPPPSPSSRRGIFCCRDASRWRAWPSL